jgi:hypothetical protein
MTLKQTRERGDLIEVFKILNGLTDIDPSLFWEAREARSLQATEEGLVMSSSHTESFKNGTYSQKHKKMLPL